jgi:hypothetical protein
MNNCNDSNTLSYKKENNIFGMEEIQSITQTTKQPDNNTQKTIHGIPIEIYCGEVYKQLAYIRQEKYLLFSKYKDSNKYQDMELSTIKDRVKLKQLNEYEQLYIHTLDQVITLMKQ